LKGGLKPWWSQKEAAAFEKEKKKGNAAPESLNYLFILERDGVTMKMQHTAATELFGPASPSRAGDVIAALQTAIDQGLGDAPVVVTNSGESGSRLRPFDHLALGSKGDKLLMW
jgi:hypothetical protein